MIIYPYKTCKKELSTYDKGICCDHFNHWVRHTCNALSDVDYKLLQNKNESWYCIPCTKEIFAFCHIEEKKTIISKSLSEPSPSLVKLIDQLNNFTEETRIKTSTKTSDNSRFRNIHKEKEYSFFQIH